MRSALLTLAVMGSQLTTPVSYRVPDVNVERLCKSRSADNKIMHEPDSQSVADCVREEAGAKQDLTKIWTQTDRLIRDRCVAEAAALGTGGYIDLLSCLQMADDIRPGVRGAAGSGRGKR